MRRNNPWSGIAAAVVLLLSVAVARGDRELVDILEPDEVPKPIQKAVQARFKDAEVISAYKENEDGKLLYGIIIRHQGHEIEVTLAPDGGILLFERTIKNEDLPKAVVNTLKDKYPEGTYSWPEEVVQADKREEKLVYYQVPVSLDKKQVEVRVTPEGKILKEKSISVQPERVHAVVILKGAHSLIEMQGRKRVVTIFNSNDKVLKISPVGGRSGIHVWGLTPGVSRLTLDYEDGKKEITYVIVEEESK